LRCRISVYICRNNKRTRDDKDSQIQRSNSIKVDFNKSNHTRVIDEKIGDSITKAHGTETFTINGKSYVIFWSMTRKEKASKTLSFEGFTCGDSEKKNSRVYFI
jgi:hypothetical protein